MRESQLQTPQKDQITANRRSKSTPDASKKNRKTLNLASEAISEEKVSDFANETAEFGSPISAVSPVTELSENSVVNSVDSVVISTPETIVPLDQSSSSSSSKSMITSVASVPKCESESIKNTLPIEVKVMVKHLSSARTQVLNSTIEYKSKKVLDVLLETIIKEFHGGLCKERDLVYQLLSREAVLIFLSFTFVVLAMFVFRFLTSGESGHSMRPPPT